MAELRASILKPLALKLGISAKNLAEQIGANVRPKSGVLLAEDVAARADRRGLYRNSPRISA